MVQIEGALPTFADLLRLRDVRRERLLDRRAKHLEKSHGSDSTTSKCSTADRKGKGKGKGKQSVGGDNTIPAAMSPSATSTTLSVDQHSQVQPYTRSNRPSNDIDTSFLHEIRNSVSRELYLRRELLRLDLGRGKTATDGANVESDSAHALSGRSETCADYYDAHPALRPMSSFLLQPDLQEHIERLESEKSTRTEAAVCSGGFTRAWLLSKCRPIVVAAGADAVADEAVEALCTELFVLLRSDRSDDDIQSQLLELVGFDNMEFLGSLISERTEIVRGITAESDRARAAELRNDRNIPGVQAIVRTERDVAIEKEATRMRRKAKRKGKEADADAADEHAPTEEQQAARILGFGSDLRRARERQLTQRAPEVLRPASEEPLQFPHVYTSSPAGRGSGSMLSMFGTKFSLPVGTKRDELGDHEEITIPFAKPAAQRQTERPVAIGEMDPLCQYTFRKYTSLNRIQSIIYPTAYGTNENILLSAPTGAGKTDVALLTILRTISQYCTPSPSELGWTDTSRKPALAVARSEFKIVYVAPMKALAAEVVEKYRSRLQWLGIQCRELTGDMQLTKAEVKATQIIVTTPEKWDVVTRKGSGDMELVDQVKLLIVDEIHLLNEDRGSVLETLIARTQRQVEARQTMIRLVGLSATLPNYVDVSNFLGVNPHKGLFYFDSGYRPVPLEQHFVGVHGKAGTPSTNRLLNRVCYERVSQLVAEGNQVMVFVHARKDTVKTAQALCELAQKDGASDDFISPEDTKKHTALVARVAKSRNRELRELYTSGFTIHHAGMLRSDRNLAEELFGKGLVRVLCCTSTLAWGVNLPAYAVVIKGTQVYDSQKGKFADLSILDVLQIFGRAGRPQYESHGVGYIITTHDRLSHYVSAITMQQPIESRFASNMVDNLNAEISLGTVTNIEEGVAWLGYTYLFIRMQKNPLVYGLTGEEVSDDPMLGHRRGELIRKAAMELSRLQMIVFDSATGFMAAKDLGRISSAYYLRHESIEIFNQLMRARMTEADSIAMLSRSKEFDQIRARNTETLELKELLKSACCCDVRGGADSAHGKTSILLQAAISRAIIDDFALVSDCAYVAQNGARIVRALFEIALSRRWGPAAAVALSLSKAVERRMWPFEHPIKQFPIPQHIMRYLESDSGVIVDMEQLYTMDSGELGALVRNQHYGVTLAAFVRQFPRLELQAEVAPITRGVLRVTLTVSADFEWNDRVHGSAEAFWIWVEDVDNTEIYYTENVLLRRKGYLEPRVSVFTIPIHEPVPTQIFVRAMSDRWIGAESVTPVSLRHLVLPEHYETHTDLLDLQPLSITALGDPCLEAICRERFTHFNPVQTQIFHTLYRQPYNALVGAPTGSGKTVAAELAMWWAFREHPRRKVVYIAPLKALVKERVIDWGRRVAGPMGRSLIELTGDVTPDPASIRRADIIITTPEKWDGVSRAWHARDYVQHVSLVIIDEIHLLGGDRGPILEVIVSRMNHIAAQTGTAVRVVGLSTALANARDLADWLGVARAGLFNFRHSVRPVPLEMYIDGFPGRHYCPRMAAMNRPAYRAIRTHSPNKPVLIFVSSRRQTRLTAQDLIAFCGVEDNPRHFLHMDDAEIELVLERTNDPNLRLALSFGIGMHHAGLTEGDRRICEQLFHDRKIQVLVATSTLAWGVNLPAHLVILKGTEFFDARSGGYVDFPLTDVLQMVGRAGRPQFDDRAVARIFVTDSKKEFYKRFLHEPFPVESSLHTRLHEHINAEIAAGTISSAQDAVEYLSWTYLYRRLRQNPSYYGVKESSEAGINRYLSDLVSACFGELERAQCVVVEFDYARGHIGVSPTPLGKIASQYYLSHATMLTFSTRLETIDKGNLVCDLLHLLSEATEWAELPVRHNEDLLNRELERKVPFPIARGGRVDYLSPHAKTNLLLQKHMVRGELPCSDYITDTRTVLDSSIRILQAMADIASIKGDLVCALAVMELMQAIKQAAMPTDSPLLQLDPEPSAEAIRRISSAGTRKLRCLGELLVMSDAKLRSVFAAVDSSEQQHVEAWCRGIRALPAVDMTFKLGPGSPAASGERGASGDSAKPPTLDSLIPQTQYSLIITIAYAPAQTAFATHALIKEPGQAFTPRFGKTQYEGWWVLLAQDEELLAVKRVAMQGNTQSGKNTRGSKAPLSANGTSSSDVHATTQSRTTKLLFITPEKPGSYSLRLLLASDAYLGLDQEFEVPITVIGGANGQMVLPLDKSAFTKDRVKEYQ
ncbi:putative steryl acetyl hydrolase mug81 [Coemansia guatemalensis]|uniref:Steryl acetyl hydrolase mug81 n=1 Tax=Coemansia guatemalensis TaxID=2761395 RepID=A0A9W8HZF0_9FUNG|nr:putative steryl acetyl hydrolase mug81 [Coemansia guatemalensis]